MSDEITLADIESYKAFIGRAVTEVDVIDSHIATLYAATLDRPHRGATLPPLWHYGLFRSSVATRALGPDGHPPRGDFMPPVKLPRRMFAGADVRSVQSLVVGEEVERESRIASVDHRQGKTGHLVFVRAAMIYRQRSQVCIEEDQTIVYRAAGSKVAPVMSSPWKPLADGETAEDWLPSTVELFRFSSVTFNSHRIHYDLPYAMDEEGYPGLVVHGPLTATRLCDFAGRLAGRPLTRFTFRGEAPAFAGQPLRLVGKNNGNEIVVRAERCDGVSAMTATAIA